MAELNVDLVAADRKVWSGAAREVSAPSADGQIGILAGHTPLLAVLRPGIVKVSTAPGQVAVEAQVSGGFVSVDANVVTIVVDEITEVSGRESALA
ncbi:ATP synthase F1 subcomplex epsilon subunit [Isoptericola sp. CG 20/1183]|uniref:ATP synthase epsilon chain n=1 Tax=Isoptericola halotolerans TaxID=300560 RepID=A0ABX5ECQ4_9MICO|nr:MULTISPECIES: F0F1 ATP synthase subunit epsilon [Isoptericola]MCK0116165.1 F0F1 ATP synthase subunit epsilon [Isoptericola sp. S6320L]PRZ04852.1 ATP synthase F1 subcomplex epsilon subunit [Isoptericola halotolerans]PRZ05343.1 ATP synthase F1 subcomplex epsilon subunit [Isoptericola sp. CG 20/1183]